MATHKSARKRMRQSIKRQARNRQRSSAAKTAVKNLRGAIAGGDADAAATAMRRAESLLRRAASRGVLTRKRVSRQISRLAKHSHALTR